MRLRSFIEFQGMLDLRDYVTGQTARMMADSLYPPALYVPQRYRELDRPAPGVRDDLADELMRQVAADHGRFVLVLSDETPRAARPDDLQQGKERRLDKTRRARVKEAAKDPAKAEATDVAR